jgi:murein DD-endopeptidase MepM/ murein hydrolase activator NlpD
MSRSERSFPIGLRFMAVGAALATLLGVVPTAGAAPTAEDVQTAHQAYASAQAKVDEYAAQIRAKQNELNAAAQRVEEEEAELERLEAQIVATQRRIADAEAEYERIRARLDARAAEAFMSGTASGLELFLGATSLADLSDRIEFVDAMSRLDADLAQQAANLQAKLEWEEAELERLRVAQRQSLAKVKATYEQIADVMRAIQRLQTEALATVQFTLTRFQEIRKQRKEYLEAQAQQTLTAAPHTPVELPPGFDNPLEICPVDQPRAFGDGFGAPRYVGGFHLHGGVDISAPSGTPIRAPFDGVAKTSSSGLGGLQVYVYGATGYVFNAHLSGYSNKANGPVRTNDIIGYVGETGDAIGAHDHFEWHPNEVPAGWPASYYGYSVIGSAVNPYPILVDVCG